MGAASGLETPPAPAPAAAPPVLPAPPAPRRPRRTPSAQVPTRSTCTRCARACRCSPARCSGTSARPAKPRARWWIRGRSRTAHALPDPSRRRRGAADRPQADPRRLGAAGRRPRSSEPRARTLSSAPRRPSGRCCWRPSPSSSSCVLRDPGVHLPRCERGEVRAGEVDRRVLAALEFLSVSGSSRPSPLPAAPSATLVGGARPAPPTPSAPPRAMTLDLSAIDGTPIAGHEGPGLGHRHRGAPSAAPAGHDEACADRQRAQLPGERQHATLPGYRGLIHVVFAAHRRGAAPARARPRRSPRARR